MDGVRERALPALALEALSMATGPSRPPVKRPYGAANHVAPHDVVPPHAQVVVEGRGGGNLSMCGCEDLPGAGVHPGRESRSSNQQAGKSILGPMRPSLALTERGPWLQHQATSAPPRHPWPWACTPVRSARHVIMEAKTKTTPPPLPCPAPARARPLPFCP